MSSQGTAEEPPVEVRKSAGPGPKTQDNHNDLKLVDTITNQAISSFADLADQKTKLIHLAPKDDDRPHKNRTHLAPPDQR